MRFYVGRTTFPGADAPIKRYFSTEENARKWVESQDNGEWYPEYDNKITVIPYEGCSGDDLDYWNI